MQVENNKVASIYYQAYDNNTGALLESNFNSDPLDMIHGMKHVIPGIENGILGMKVGEMREFVLKTAEAYGEYKEESIKEFPASQFEGIDLRDGMTLVSIDDNNKKVYVKVAGFDDETVKVDYNHPLSGKDLKIKVELVDLRDAMPEEIESGVVYRENDGCGCGSGCGCHG